jgi:phytoene dehydrogenase-like protein
VIELLIPSTIDDSLAPPGAHVASLFCQHFRRHLPAGHSWDASKAAAIERIVATVDAYAPNFRRSIVAMDAYSPVDLERRFGLVGGDIFHGVMSPDQLYWSRPARGFSHYRSPVPGLYMCASGTHPGGGVTGAPGHNAAQTILSDLRGQAVRPPRIA